GTEGRLGGQARVQGVSGTWQDLTHNVNQLASNLTTQVRAIGEVSTAVAQGDLTRQIAVDAAGEVAELKDNVNQMIANLRETTRKNADQDWLNSNLARISGLMQGQRNLETACQLIMSEVTPLVNAHRGAMYLVEQAPDGDRSFKLIAGYGLTNGSEATPRFRPGEGLVGQAAVERRQVMVPRVPAGYLSITSGLGNSPPAQVVVLPVLFEEEVLAVIELATLGEFSEGHRNFFDQFIGTVGIVLNTITANVRTEELLGQSQLLTSELQDTNDELAEKARLLERQNRDIEVKNEEIEAAQVALQERAEQLALSSRYKSEFLANMSHELRNPLNSLLILARLLSEDTEGNLTDKQIDYARTIHGAGTDLLALINDILDLSKIEAGKMQLHPTWLSVRSAIDELVHSFTATAEQKGLSLDVSVADDVPAEILTDEQRLQQVLRNLLSNAIKFTELGGVQIVVSKASPDTEFNSPQLASSPARVVQFDVIDTGIGVSPEKLKVIFEAFQQADGTTSRRYGGTGLGLSISREITGLLGGEIRVRSAPEQGSTFTLYIPEKAAFDVADEMVTGSVTPWAELAADHQGSLGDGRSAGGYDSSSAAPTEGSPAQTSSGERLLRTRTALVVGPHELRRHDVSGLIGGQRVEAVGAGTLEAAVAHLQNRAVDCVVLDLSPEPELGFAFLEHLVRAADGSAVPVIVAHAFDALDEDHIGRLAVLRQVLTIRQADGPNQLVAATAPYLTPGVSSRSSGSSEGQRSGWSEPDPVLLERRVLIVDDDVRNVFAVSAALEAQGMIVRYAENGYDGLRELETDPDVDIVLMDIMMPEMDGYETMRAIRALPRFASLPIVALTAKALTGDREKAIEAGATAYVTKPVDIDRLVALVRLQVEPSVTNSERSTPASGAGEGSQRQEP
ncbi:MAG: hypothetical protein QOJ19_4141, partial [Acidimicrobiia bacterium]|nr:hypothetical protein [Acidimicrobiia bacterium]